jgi:hypothetical protein
MHITSHRLGALRAGLMAGALAFLPAAAAGPAWKTSSEPAAVPSAGDGGSRAAFDRLRALEGRWRGRSSKGWQDQVGIRLIAKGSTLVETSEFDAHPGETMITTIAPDGDRLLLTHYCVAGNQPRLAAAGLQEDGRSILFTFVDGGNLRSRDDGHMDKALYRFLDADHFSAQWTWFENGAERWMEEIHFERIP